MFNGVRKTGNYIISDSDGDLMDRNWYEKHGNQMGWSGWYEPTCVSKMSLINCRQYENNFLGVLNLGTTSIINKHSSVLCKLHFTRR